MTRSQRFLHTLSESKKIIALEQKAFDLSFVKNAVFLLGHLVDCDTQLHSNSKC